MCRDVLDPEYVLFSVTERGKSRVCQKLLEEYKTLVINTDPHESCFMAKGLRKGSGEAFLESFQKFRVPYRQLVNKSMLDSLPVCVMVFVPRPSFPPAFSSTDRGGQFVIGFPTRGPNRPAGWFRDNVPITVRVWVLGGNGFLRKKTLGG